MYFIVVVDAIIVVDGIRVLLSGNMILIGLKTEVLGGSTYRVWVDIMYSSLFVAILRP